MAKIFISYSSKNEELAKLLKDFLQMGMGIARDEIFCTADSYTLLTGEEFIESIRNGIEKSEAVILLITEEYLKSQFCLAEMGAAWYSQKKVYPLLTVKYELLENTPIKGLQMRRLDASRDIGAVYDEFYKNEIITSRCTPEYMERIEPFISQVKTILNGEYLLEMDEDGYYHTEITAIRNVPAEYRCYKIKGHIEEWKDVDSVKTDWLFFRYKVYEELQIGDKVRFKITNTNEKVWRDIGKARDIYPADLVKED